MNNQQFENNGFLPYGQDKYRPLSAWAYFFIGVLYRIPIIGFIFLVIDSIGAYNLNRRSYARSFWCRFIIGVAIFVAVLVFGMTGALAGILNALGMYDITNALEELFY